MKMPDKETILFLLSLGLLHKGKIEKLSWQRQVLALLAILCISYFGHRLIARVEDPTDPSSDSQQNGSKEHHSPYGYTYSKKPENSSVEEWEKQYPVRR